MSTSALICTQCRTKLAVFQRSGRIRPLPGVGCELVMGGVRLTCRCGATRVIRVLADRT